MITQIKVWGNSQGLRLNKNLLSNAGISTGDDVDVEAKDGTITISPAKSRRKKYSLQELVDRIPDGYDAFEPDWGKPVGKEAW